MNENIDLTKILKDCPKGHVFYSPMCGRVLFDALRLSNAFPIAVQIANGETVLLTKEGKYYEFEDAECVLFPSKDQRDWSKFTAPWYKKERFDHRMIKPFVKYKTMKEKAYIARDKNGDLYIYTKGKPYKGACIWATDHPNCAAKIDNHILPEIKWEDEEPTEVSIEIVSQQTREQLNQQIKFDPNTLKPFDKVIVADYEHHNWKCDLFSHIVEHSHYSYRCIGNVYKYCIPYNDDTKHLVGTTEEAPEYYRYWGN